MSWNHDLKTYLIRAGTVGLSGKEITILFKNHVLADVINAELEGLRSDGYIQKFRLPAKSSGRPTVIWRATTKWLTDDNDRV